MRGHAAILRQTVSRDHPFRLSGGHALMEARGHAPGHGGSRVGQVTGRQSLRLEMRDPLVLTGEGRVSC